MITLEEDATPELRAPVVNKKIAFTARFSAQANEDALNAALWLVRMTGDEELGRQWYVGLRKAVSALPSDPRCHPVQKRESLLFGVEMRRFLYRRAPGSTAAHYVYYVVNDRDEDEPLVIILHVQHARRKPLVGSEERGSDTSE